MAKSDIKKMNFEDAMNELEEIVIKLENGNASLDESIADFEAAVKLIRVCEEKLSSAKQRVKILTESADGSVTDLPFAVSNDDET